MHWQAGGTALATPLLQITLLSVMIGFCFLMGKNLNKEGQSRGLNNLRIRAMKTPTWHFIKYPRLLTLTLGPEAAANAIRVNGPDYCSLLPASLF